jgi:hypothetical protein
MSAVYDKPADDPYILEEMQAIERAIELESQNLTARSLISIFRKDKVRTRHRVILAWGVQFMNQAGGINLVVYYIPCKSSYLLENFQSLTFHSRIGPKRWHDPSSCPSPRWMHQHDVHVRIHSTLYRT